MEMEKPGQLELFSQTEGNIRVKERSPGFFRTCISGREKAILMVIGFAVTGIISFSLGVERGKKLVVLNVGSRLNIAARPLPAAAVPAVAQTRQAPPIQAAPKAEYQAEDYTIQVASFLNKINAQKEASVLKGRGLSPLVLSKGKFSIVCVGSFSKKEEAESFLPKIKKQYQDCRIRRL